MVTREDLGPLLMPYTYLPTFEIRKKGHWCSFIFIFNIIFFLNYFSPENWDSGTSRFLGIFKLGNWDSPGKKLDNWQVCIYISFVIFLPTVVTFFFL